MAQRAPYGAAIRFYEALVADTPETPECIMWPFCRNAAGYAVFGRRRGRVKSALVSRVLCGDIHGLPPTADYEAAHTCGNGHLGCVNPNHLIWKTSKENKADQLRHGTRNSGERNGQAKLDIHQVQEIRRQRGRVSQRVLAERFDVDQSTISDIQLGKRWGRMP